MAALVSTASSVLTSAPILVSTDGKSMSIYYCLSLLTMLTGHGATVSNIPESPKDTSTLTTLPHKDVLDAEVRILHGKYIYIFVCILLIFSFFLFLFFIFYFLFFIFYFLFFIFYFLFFIFYFLFFIFYFLFFIFYFLFFIFYFYFIFSLDCADER